MARLSTSTSNDVITHLKSIFARHGIPQTVMSDNGPQYAAAAFVKFAQEYGFAHITSSPRYPQSNGAAERAVRTVKSLLDKNGDPYAALLAYRSTPLENGYSPAELLMGRKLRTTVPVALTQLVPHLPNFSKLKEKEKQLRERQRKNFNHHHRAVDLKPLQAGDNVWIPDTSSEGTVVTETNPRSYVVQTPDGIYRRNRRHLLLLPQPVTNDTNTGGNTQVNPTESAPSTDTKDVPDTAEIDADHSVVRTRSGRISKPPDRL